MQIRENISLIPYNTFGIKACAEYFAEFSSISELQEVLQQYSPVSQGRKLILGGGSNLLLTGNVEGLVLKNNITGIHVISEDDDYIFLKAGAGENWHRLVMFCVNNGFAGMENLALIPGNTGASPLQNIGAYGVEVKDIFHELEAYHLNDHQQKIFTASDCEFGYRESIFKNRYKGQFVITTVTYRLYKKPKFSTEYGAIQQELERMKVQSLSIAAVVQAVINIRSSKLPDPAIIGNAGSFFKNPVVPQLQFQKLKDLYPYLPSFSVDKAHTKIPAGWLIEQCGWKGFRRGDAGCYAKQALVLVNYGTATGMEIYNLSEEILQSVKEKFGILLVREVNIV